MAGYSAAPLAKKLGIKEGFKCIVVNEPEKYFDRLSPLPETEAFKKATQIDFAHLFVLSFKDFSKLFLSHKRLLKKDGMMWISWPKKSSKVPTDLDENIIRDFGLKNGLVDVKVCAVDETWSGLKFVYRLSDR